MKKLYLCSAIAVEYEPSGVVVAKSEQEAEEHFKNMLDEENVWYTGSVSAYEIKIDGYEIIVKEVKNE